MAITALEVLDSAVKIGLGAAIGGVFSFLNLRRTQQHDFNKDLFQKRQVAIEKISADVQATTDVIALMITSLYLLHTAKPVGALRIQFEGSLQEAADNLRIKKGLLANAQSTLFLLSLSEAAQSCQKFNSLVSDFSTICNLEQTDRKKVASKYDEIIEAHKTLMENIREHYGRFIEVKIDRS